MRFANKIIVHDDESVLAEDTTSRSNGTYEPRLVYNGIGPHRSAKGWTKDRIGYANVLIEDGRRRRR